MKGRRFRNAEALWQALKSTWNQIPREHLIKQLYNSMARRLAAVIVAGATQNIKVVANTRFRNISVVEQFVEYFS